MTHNEEKRIQVAPQISGTVMIQSLTVISEDVIIGKREFSFSEKEHSALVARSVCVVPVISPILNKHLKYANIKRIVFFIDRGYAFDTLKYISLKPFPETLVFDPPR